MKTTIVLLFLLPLTSALSSIATRAHKGRSMKGGVSMTFDDTGRSSSFYRDASIAKDPDFITPTLQKKNVAPFPQQTRTTLPSSLDLPRHSPDQQTISRLRLLEDTEMMLGRVAMIAALVLFSVELTTGQSLPHQIASLLKP